ncbi:MAG TPA: hypothetical protein VFR48_06200 [Solirubrobacteraceae bacterium]|nr:hypothetical protein [Solirubrobacteraceae bacterium]
MLDDLAPLSADTSVWLDERVQPVHLSTDHAAAQFVERLAWAISDAEDAGDVQLSLGARSIPRPRGSRPATRTQLRARTLRRSEEL